MKWEYKMVDSNTVHRQGLLKGKSQDDIESYLNEIGADGWEIINLDFREFEGRLEFSGIAKRKIPDV